MTRAGQGESGLTLGEGMRSGLTDGGGAMRALVRIITVAAVLLSGSALSVTSGAPAALAQDAGTAGVAVGTTSAGAGELVVKGTQTRFMSRGLISTGLLYPGARTYSDPGEQSFVAAQCSGLNSGAVAKLTTAWNALHTSTTATDMTLLAMKEHWQANTVRFHLSQGVLAYENENNLSQYTDAVLSVIQQARAMGLVVIVDVDTEPYSCTPQHNYPAGGSGTVRLPTGKTKQAWAQLTPVLGNDAGVIMEPMNEPDSATECGTLSWASWASGCGSPDIGMQALGSWLRTAAPNPAGQNTGVSNVLLFDADQNGGTFAGFNAASLSMPSNSAYAVHPFYYIDGPTGSGATGWDNRFGTMETAPSAGQGLAVVADAWNESANCPASDPNNYGKQLVNSYLPAHNIGLTLEGWDAPAAGLVSLPLSTSDTTAGDPVTSLAPQGCGFTGADLAYAKFWSQAGVTVPTDAVQVSPPLTWKNGVVDAVSVALASNGTQWANPPISPSTPPDVVSSVNLRVAKACSATSTWVANMNLSDTGSWWDNGSFTAASASQLSGASVTAQTGDCLIFRVYYQGVSGYQDTTYKVPSQS
jgi:Cellulase (glycosyl hydrolase family 5)